MEDGKKKHWSKAETSDEIWKEEFYLELFQEICLIREEETKDECDEPVNGTTIKVDPALVESSIRFNKRKKLFNKTVKIIISTVHKKQFQAAEYLREQLFEINPNASSEIFKIGQFIEREKRKYKLQVKAEKKEQFERNISALQKESDKDLPFKSVNVQELSGDRNTLAVETVAIEFMESWFDLYRTFTGKESAVFKSVLRKEVFTAKQIIVEQHKPCPRLYFINAGSATMYETHDEKRSAIKQLNTGELAGSGCFFTGKPSDYSVEVDPDTEVEYLEQKDLKTLESIYPELIEKLKKYCQL